MPPELLLDVRNLAPPEPLERVLATLGSLGEGKYLRVRIHREPFPLYAWLQESGFAWRTRSTGDVAFELCIWRCGDARAVTEISAFTMPPPETS
jgi:uncharacterized protein (DUF2249 family)